MEVKSSSSIAKLNIKRLPNLTDIHKIYLLGLSNYLFCVLHQYYSTSFKTPLCLINAPLYTTLVTGNMCAGSAPYYVHNEKAKIIKREEAGEDA